MCDRITEQLIDQAAKLNKLLINYVMITYIIGCAPNCLKPFKAYFLRDAPTGLTLRRLMSYIYMEHPFLMFLDHTQRRSTVGRTPLDE